MSSHHDASPCGDKNLSELALFDKSRNDEASTVDCFSPGGDLESGSSIQASISSDATTIVTSYDSDEGSDILLMDIEATFPLDADFIMDRMIDTPTNEPVGSDDMEVSSGLGSQGNQEQFAGLEIPGNRSPKGNLSPSSSDPLTKTEVGIKQEMPFMEPLDNLGNSTGSTSPGNRSPKDNFSPSSSDPLTKTEVALNLEMPLMEPLDNLGNSSGSTSPSNRSPKDKFSPSSSDPLTKTEVAFNLEMPLMEPLDNLGTGNTSGSTSPLLISTPPTSPLDVDSNHWLRSESVASFLTIPLLNGFDRTTLERGDGSVVVYRAERTGQVLTDVDEVHDYLVEMKIEIPIAFFTFDPEILVNARNSTDPDLVYMDDLSKGQERIPIPVICQKTIKPGHLAKYITKPILTKDLLKENILSYDHDEEFLVCCNCPNDCKDKMNCACFLKTLDNCSKKTRNEVGDEKVGYSYQRLEQSFLSGIFECNKRCKCHKQTCFNRVVQNGIFCRLEMFMTRQKGWGVRTMVDIPKGTFICTYAGEIVGADYAEEVSKSWSSGKWKFLSELRLGEEGKEGYEEQAVEPDESNEEKRVEPIVETSEVKSHVKDENQVTSSACDIMDATQELSHKEEIKEPDFDASQVGISVVNENKENVSAIVLESTLNKSSPQTTSRKNSVEAPSSSDRQLMSPLETDDYWWNSSRRIQPIVRSIEEMTLLETLTLQSLTRSRFPISSSSSVPLRWTQFVFRKDLREFDSPCVPSILENVGETTDKSVRSDRKKLKRLNNRTTRISRKKGKRLKRAWTFRRKTSKRAAIKKRAGNQPERVHQLLDLSLSIDGIDCKNVGGYLNHSCSPNVFPQYVFWDCHDLRLPVIAFYASKNILRGEELSWNYNYESEEFHKGDDEHCINQRRLPCHCNADNCKRTMYNS